MRVAQKRERRASAPRLASEGRASRRCQRGAKVRLWRGAVCAAGRFRRVSARSRIGPSRPWRGVSCDCRSQKFGDLGFHHLLVEHLAAGDAVDLRAQRRDAVLIGVLHARLPRDGGADQIVAQHEIGGGQE